MYILSNICWLKQHLKWIQTPRMNFSWNKRYLLHHQLFWPYLNEALRNWQIYYMILWMKIMSISSLKIYQPFIIKNVLLFMIYIVLYHRNPCFYLKILGLWFYLGSGWIQYTVILVESFKLINQMLEDTHCLMNKSR